MSEPLRQPAIGIIDPTSTVRTRPPGRPSAAVYVGLAAALTVAVVLGFARTFFFRPWYPEWARVHGAPETIFYVHGVAYAAWLLLLLAQTSLVAAGRVDIHRRLGLAGAGLAVVMVVLGAVGSLMAAARPTGFIDIPMPPLQFLVVPFTILVLFAVFVTLGDPQPAPSPESQALHDPRVHRAHRGRGRTLALRVHDGPVPRARARHDRALRGPVPGADDRLGPRLPRPAPSRDAVGRTALIANQLLRMPLAGTSAWLAFAGWAVSLVSS